MSGFVKESGPNQNGVKMGVRQGKGGKKLALRMAFYIAPDLTPGTGR